MNILFVYLVAHKIFGIPSTISCANYVYFIALEKLLELKNINLIKIYSGNYLAIFIKIKMDIFIL